MSTTPNLLIDLLASSQNNKYVTVNDAFDNFDGALTDLLPITMTTADYVMTTGEGGEALGHMAYILTGTIGAPRNLIVPTNKKLYIVANQTTGSFAVTVKTPSGTGIALSDSTYHLLYCDGTNVVALSASVSGTLAFAGGLTDTPANYSGAGDDMVVVNTGATALVFIKKKYKVGGFAPGSYTGSQICLAVPVDEAVTFPANFTTPTSQATLGTAATASTVFLIQKTHSGSTTTIGTITFAGSGTVGTFASTGGTAQSLAVGDILSVVAPSSPDATAASLGFLLSGTY